MSTRSRNHTTRRGNAGPRECPAGVSLGSASALHGKAGHALRFPSVDAKGRQRAALFGASAILLVIASLFRPQPAKGNDTLPAAFAPHPKHRTYTARFRRAENPISEGGAWINGRTVGLDWADVRMRPKLAFGTEAGRIKYDDAVRHEVARSIVMQTQSDMTECPITRTLRGVAGR